MTEAVFDIDKLKEQVGESLGVSDWLTIDQEMIDAFAEVTRDPDPMHIDPEWSTTHGPFNSTIAFGFLTLSLITHLFHNVMQFRSNKAEDGPNYGLNYGFERVRLMAPVPVGSRIRGRFSLNDIRERAPGEFIQAVDVTVEIEGQEKPALVCQWLTMIVYDEGHKRISTYSGNG